MTASAFLRPPSPGITLDDDTLTLDAWHAPRPVPLDNIDHFRMLEWTGETDMVLIYKDGSEEIVPASDLPDSYTFSALLADRNIAVRDPLPTP